MNEQALGRVIPWLAALFIGMASEFFPIVGMLAAALVFPQGIHSAHAVAYLALAMSLNFAIFFTATFHIFRFFIRRGYRTISK
jgi:C4-dicarboxylate transporter